MDERYESILTCQSCARIVFRWVGDCKRTHRKSVHWRVAEFSEHGQNSKAVSSRPAAEPETGSSIRVPAKAARAWEHIVILEEESGEVRRLERVNLGFLCKARQRVLVLWFSIKTLSPYGRAGDLPPGMLSPEALHDLIAQASDNEEGPYYYASIYSPAIRGGI